VSGSGAASDRGSYDTVRHQAVEHHYTIITGIISINHMIITTTTTASRHHEGPCYSAAGWRAIRGSSTPSSLPSPRWGECLGVMLAKVEEDEDE
jgi:hypothetical protein